MDRKNCILLCGGAIMIKFKKIVSGTLAGCLMASALMMSAGAVNIPADTSPAYMAEDSQVTTHILVL